jgi:hypothetical protein
MKLAAQAAILLNIPQMRLYFEEPHYGFLPRALRLYPEMLFSVCIKRELG